MCTNVIEKMTSYINMFTHLLFQWQLMF